LRDKTQDDCRSWFTANQDYLYPTAQGNLEVDEEAKAFETPPSQIKFFEVAVAAMASGGADAQRAAKLLKRYVPLGPDGESQAEWRQWVAENRAYLFFSEAGGYRWYLDPLAKKRQMPTADLRGPARASLP
jgi:hypothetical protein